MSVHHKKTKVLSSLVNRNAEIIIAIDADATSGKKQQSGKQKKNWTALVTIQFNGLLYCVIYEHLHFLCLSIQNSIYKSLGNNLIKLLPFCFFPVLNSFRTNRSRWRLKKKRLLFLNLTYL